MNAATGLPDAYLSLDECRDAIFEGSERAPSRRTWAEWRRRGYFPVLKIGKRVFANPVQVRAAIERRFRIQAAEPAK